MWVRALSLIFPRFNSHTDTFTTLTHWVCLWWYAYHILRTGKRFVKFWPTHHHHPSLTHSPFLCKLSETQTERNFHSCPMFAPALCVCGVFFPHISAVSCCLCCTHRSSSSSWSMTCSARRTCDACEGHISHRAEGR